MIKFVRTVHQQLQIQPVRQISILIDSYCVVINNTSLYSQTPPGNFDKPSATLMERWMNSCSETDKETIEEVESHIMVDHRSGKGTELYVACFNPCCVMGDKLVLIKDWKMKNYRKFGKSDKYSESGINLNIKLDKEHPTHNVPILQTRCRQRNGTNF